MKPLIPMALATALCLPAAPMGAHPHVFVDVALRFNADAQGHLTEVEVTWSYDDFFSLLILTDMGLDPDGDGTLTEAELDKLKGFDLVEWPEGFEGDLYMYQGETKIALDHPIPTGIALTNGRIIATHTRTFGPVKAEGLRIEAYDPTYYVAHSLAGPITLPKGCVYTITEPDLDESQEQFRQMLSELTAEEQYTGVEIGNLFSESLSVTCAAPS
ncbi:ABC-type uncharacterized transport system, periplasmic component [Roseovarius mucosus DSM 17069]|uniref:ABC-type uncharacterized transport system, periplasmic component n=1 Tax=Roseovarius mucosus DSM 17069 TaxID=1288298 RepID=A0A0A0HJX6_9RHOB|nr:DUF1007 family protein [Roseovarius mucosus]KGM87221.1 ABC-type uncharacterized transport system, periplasmic component [Roseovarius mucosus DSM 17069]